MGSSWFEKATSAIRESVFFNFTSIFGSLAQRRSGVTRHKMAYLMPLIVPGLSTVIDSPRHSTRDTVRKSTHGLSRSSSTSGTDRRRHFVTKLVA